MNRLTLWLNTALWVGNALTWSVYAGSAKMALASLAAAALAGWLAWTADPWDGR